MIYEAIDGVLVILVCGLTFDQNDWQNHDVVGQFSPHRRTFKRTNEP